MRVEMGVNDAHVKDLESQLVAKDLSLKTKQDAIGGLEIMLADANNAADKYKDMVTTLLAYIVKNTDVDQCDKHDKAFYFSLKQLAEGEPT
jgi:hypothetical protein